MRKLLKLMGLTLALTAMTITASSMALAQEDEERHLLRVYAGYLTVSGNDTLNLSDIEFDDAGGFGLGYEFKASKLIGIPIDYAVFGPDIELEDIDDAETDFNPLTIGINFHVVNNRIIDWYLGPALAWIDYDDAAFNVQGVEVDAEFDSETTWAVKTGLDFKIFKWLGLGASIEYIDAKAEFDAGGGNDGELDPKPIITKLGISFRF